MVLNPDEGNSLPFMLLPVRVLKVAKFPSDAAVDRTTDCSCQGRFSVPRVAKASRTWFQ